MKRIFLISLVVLMFFATGFKGCSKKDNNNPVAQCPAGRVPTTANNICIPVEWGDSSTHQVDRPAGGWVFLESPATPEQKQLIGERIEAGLRQTIAGAQYHNPTWTNYATPDYYGVVMIKKQATNQDGTPALITSGIQTAGTVINARMDGYTGIPVMVLPLPDSWPDPSDNYWNYLQASARNEGEHMIEYENDLSEFIRRAVATDVHPHWTLPDGSLFEIPSPACSLNFNRKAKPTLIIFPKK